MVEIMPSEISGWGYAKSTFGDEGGNTKMDDFLKNC